MNDKTLIHPLLRHEENILETQNSESKYELFSLFYSQVNDLLWNENEKLSNRFIEKTLARKKYLPDSLLGAPLLQIDYRGSILQLLRSLFMRKFVLIGILKFLQVVFLFASPLLINELTKSLGESLERFVIFSVILVSTTLILQIVSTQYTYQLSILSTQCKAEIIKIIYMSMNSDSNIDVMNLINIDINTVTNFFTSFHECWSMVLSLIIGIVILYNQIQEALLAGLLTALLLIIINFLIAQKIGLYYKQGLCFKDIRLSLTKDFVNNPKSIKFLKWEKQMEGKIAGVREKEFSLLSKSKWLDSFCVFFWSITNTMISTATLYFYSQKNSNLENAFTVIYLFSLLTNPLNSLPWTVAGMLNAKTSFSRIDEFISQKRKLEVCDHDGILINQAVLKWSFESTFALKIEELQLSKLTFVIGSTNAGKSSFLYALLNQLKLQSGYFQVKVKSSFVPQQHWLSQGSIRSNILMESPLDESKYQECLKLSEFIHDVNKFPNKDFFDVGPDGQRLSGGQKQRLSICRALYNQRELYLFDDVFSSLDPQVADAIFENLQSLSKPIIMVLNDSYLKRYKTRATQIILMKDGQAITDKREIKEYLNSLESESEETQKLCEQKKSEAEIQEDSKLKSRQPSITESEDLVEIRESKQSISFYLTMLGRFNTFWIIISLSLMQASFNIYDAWLNSYINGTPFFLFSNSFTTTLFLLTGADLIIKAQRAVSFSYGHLDQARKIFTSLLKSVIYAKASFFDKEESGQILTRFSNDQSTVDDRFPFELNLLCNNVFNFLGTFILLIALQWQMIFPTFVSIGIFYKIQSVYRPAIYQMRKLDANNNSQFLTCLFDQYKGYLLISSYEKWAEFQRLFHSKLVHMIRASWISQVLGVWLSLRLSLVATFVVVCIISFMILSMALDLPIQESTLQLLLYYSLTKVNLFSYLTLSLTKCEQELVSYERINGYCREEQEQNQMMQYSEKVKLEQIELKYSDTVTALKSVDLEIEPGQRIAFCGRTGSGKSSILSVIFGLYPNTSGTLSVPATSLFEWRRLIGIIPQMGYVFKGNLLENIGATKEQYQKIKAMIQLDDDLEIDPATISQGTRQLISFARVIFENNDYIFLDEATASVDQQIEDRIQEYLRNCGKTVVTISHRLEALVDYDKIYYLENGRLCESGTFSELARLGGGFSKLRNLE